MHCFCAYVSFIHSPAGLHKTHRAGLVSPVRYFCPHVIWNSTFPKITRLSTQSSVHTQPPSSSLLPPFLPSFLPFHTHTHTHGCAKLLNLSSPSPFTHTLILRGKLPGKNSIHLCIHLRFWAQRWESFGRNLSLSHTRTHTISLFLSQHKLNLWSWQDRRTGRTNKNHLITHTRIHTQPLTHTHTHAHMQTDVHRQDIHIH